MYIARILYPVQVLGPGNRIGIWFNGCQHKCKGCSNPELWEFKREYKTTLDTIMHLILKVNEKYTIDGFTITGGDPFLQADALAELLPELNKISNDIIVYTGYNYDDICVKYSDLIEQIAVIIDGKYIEELNDGSILRGSNNQRIFIRNEFVLKYKEYLNTAENKIQNFVSRDGVVSVGIHQPNFYKQVNDHLSTDEKE